MNVKEITTGIYYAGVNDRVTEKFEQLWSLPKGVSYNSYIVKGKDKIALIDGVRIDEVREFFSNIDRVPSSGTIDYLVINHMEPDHSGAIPELAQRYPMLKIVGNAQTLQMVRDFYHIYDADRFLEVKDGDEINLGERVLKFYLTPMVHWPETMMTYVVDSKLLFSGDAFGTFGALDGGVVDSEMNTEEFIPEMYRYYSNIVGKYGVFVQRALARLKDVEIQYICPTHGPVWHTQLAEVVGIYDRLSRYESEEGVTIIYGSMYGNTAEGAQIIARELNELGVKKIKIHNAAESSMSDMINDAFRYEGLVVGSATYSMGLFPPIETFMRAMETREIKGKKLAIFSGYTWAKNPAITALQGYAERMKLPVLATMSINRSLNEQSIAEAKALAKALVDAGLKC